MPPRVTRYNCYTGSKTQTDKVVRLMARNQLDRQRFLQGIPGHPCTGLPFEPPTQDQVKYFHRLRHWLAWANTALAGSCIPITCFCDYSGYREPEEATIYGKSLRDILCDDLVCIDIEQERRKGKVLSAISEGRKLVAPLLVVDDKHRGLGIGRKLLSLTLADAAREGYERTFFRVFEIRGLYREARGRECTPVSLFDTPVINKGLYRIIEGAAMPLGYYEAYLPIRDAYRLRVRFQIYTSTLFKLLWNISPAEADRISWQRGDME